MKKVWIVTCLVVAALGVAALIVGGRGKPGGEPSGDWSSAKSSSAAQADGAGNLPWQIEVLRNGSSMVMGLTLAHDGRGSTVQAALDQWGQTMQITIIAAPGENGMASISRWTPKARNCCSTSRQPCSTSVRVHR